MYLFKIYKDLKIKKERNIKHIFFFFTFIMNMKH